MENINEIVAALAIARGEFPLIEKTETATIKGKTKTGAAYSYNYDYAPLAEILDKTAPALSKNGLALIEAIDETESGTELTVLLAHSSGQYLSSRKLLGSFSDPKLFGGAMTYYRRYLIEGLLNIASQQDKDGQGVESEVTPKKQPKQKAAKPTEEKQKSDPWPAKSGPVYEFSEAVKTATLALPKHCHYTSQYHLEKVVGGFGDWLNDKEKRESQLSVAVDHAAAKANKEAEGENEV